MPAIALSEAGGSSRPSRPRPPSFLPRLEQAAGPVTVLRGFAGDQRHVGGHAATVFVVAEEDDFHPRLEILLAVGEAPAGDVAARTGRPRAERRARAGVALDRLAIVPAGRPGEYNGGEQHSQPDPAPGPADRPSLSGCHVPVPGG